MAPQKRRSKDETVDELKVFSDLSHLFASTLELDQTLNETVQLVSRLSHADACFLFLRDLATNDLILSASKTPHPHEVGRIRLKAGEGITGWVAKHHKPVAISKNAHEDPRFTLTLPEDQYEAFLSVPILIKNDVVGVINVQHKKPHAYPVRLINLLSTVGRQVGSAIETARLYKGNPSARESNRGADGRFPYDHARCTATPEEIMQLIVNMTAQMMGSIICSIMLLDEKGQELADCGVAIIGSRLSATSRRSTCTAAPRAKRC